MPDTEAELLAGGLVSQGNRGVYDRFRGRLVWPIRDLGGDVIGKRRQEGILSETTGESSMMFNSRPALDLPICRAAYRELAGYIYRRVGLVRG